MGPLQAVRLALATLLVVNNAVSADECQPETWRLRTLRPGDINCRLSTVTEPQVNSTTCAVLANKYHTTVDTFLDLNPGLDCDSIEPDTRYCVEGCKSITIDSLDRESAKAEIVASPRATPRQ